MNDGVPFPSRQAGKTCSIGLSTDAVYVCMYVCMCIHEKLGVGIKYLWVGLHCEVIVNKLRGRARATQYYTNGLLPRPG